jgi:two-component system response regulator FixJ
MNQIVFVVDDDPEIGKMLSWLIESIGADIEIYTSGEEFLEAYQGRLGCLILDVRMKGMSGLRLQELLQERGDKIPIIFISGHGDIPMTVRVMKNGAKDFFTKPFNNQLLLDAVQQALEQNSKQYKEQLTKDKIKTQIDSLTSREQEVLNRIIKGKLNKVIAHDLGISISTVEAHRAKVMEKMQAKSLAELIQRLLLAQKFL